MIMHDFKNVKTETDQPSAWDYIGAVSFILIMIFLIIL